MQDTELRVNFHEVGLVYYRSNVSWGVPFDCSHKIDNLAGFCKNPGKVTNETFRVDDHWWPPQLHEYEGLIQLKNQQSATQVERVTKSSAEEFLANVLIKLYFLSNQFESLVELNMLNRMWTVLRQNHVQIKSLFPFHPLHEPNIISKKYIP